MQFTKSALATTFIACLAATPLAGTIVARQGPQCQTTEASPGYENVMRAADSLGSRGGTICSHGGSGTTQPYHGDGIRVYFNGNSGSALCSDVANALRTLADTCRADVGGDIRAGGNILMPGTSGTYISVSK